MHNSDGFFESPVIAYKFHPPGHKVKVIRSDHGCLEMITEHGSRYWGFDKGWINSELRMVVQGFSSCDEIRSKWDVCNEV